MKSALSIAALAVMLAAGSLVTPAAAHDDNHHRDRCRVVVKCYGHHHHKVCRKVKVCESRTDHHH